jgi:hypothetical protein
VGSADADVVEAAVDPQGEAAVGVDAVVPDALVGVVVAAAGGGGLGAGLVGHGRGRPAGQGPVRAAVVVLVGERVEQGLQLRDGAGLVGWAASHLLRVCWKRSTLPQVVGLFGRLFFCSTWWPRSSASKASRPPAKRVVNTIALSVSVEAGVPKRATAARKRSPTIGPVTGWWAALVQGVAAVVDRARSGPRRHRRVRREGR